MIWNLSKTLYKYRAIRNKARLMVLEGSYLHAYFLWCVHYIKIPFYVLFPFMCFKKCFMTIFSWFEVWYICPLNEYLKTTRSWFCMYSRGKIVNIQIKHIKHCDTMYNFTITKYFCWKMPASWDTLVYMLIVLFCSAVHLKLLFLV